MRKWWMKFAPLWAPEGQGDGGDGRQQGDGAATGGADGDGESEGGASGGDGGGGKAGGSILDFATGDGGGDDGDDGESGGDRDGAPDGAKWTPPDDLKISADLIGKDAEETLRNLAKQNAGFRKAMSQGKLSGKVTTDLAKYVPEFTPTGDDDAVAAELNRPESKAILDAFRETAHGLGIPDQAFEKLMRDSMTKLHEAGVPMGLSDEGAIAFSKEQEYNALAEQYGAKGAQSIINTVDAYGKKMLARGVFTEADLDEFRISVGTAAASSAFYKLLTAEFGERPVPLTDGADGESTQAQALAEYEAAQKITDPAAREAAMEKAQKRMEKSFGMQPTNAVRLDIV